MRNFRVSSKWFGNCKHNYSIMPGLIKVIVLYILNCQYLDIWCINIYLFRSIRVWDYSQDSCISTLNGHQGPVRGLIWNMELPYLIVSGSWDSSIRMWDIREGTCVHALLDHGADVYGLYITKALISCFSFVVYVRLKLCIFMPLHNKVIRGYSGIRLSVHLSVCL